MMPGTKIDDLQLLLNRTHWTYAEQAMRVSELFHHCNPGGQQHPWSDDRICSVIRSAISLGYCTLDDSMGSNSLELTKCGLAFLAQDAIAA